MPASFSPEPTAKGSGASAPMRVPTAPAEADQFREAFGEVELEPILTERQIEAADHLYFTRPERTAMLEMDTSWLTQRFH